MYSFALWNLLPVAADQPVGVAPPNILLPAKDVAPANRASLVDKPEALPAAAVRAAFATGPTPGIKFTATGATF